MISQGARYRNLVAPKESILVIVDSLADRTTDRQTGGAMDVSGLLLLAEAAHISDVPRIFAQREEIGLVAPLYAPLKEFVQERHIVNCAAANPWEDGGFCNLVRNARRSRMLVAGRFTEICVSVTVLSALEEGYDAYIVADAAYSASRDHHDTAVARMAQAGAVPVTVRQIVFEWRHGSEDGNPSGGT